MKILRKIFRILFIILSVLITGLLLLIIYIYQVSDVKPPFLNDTQAMQLVRVVEDSNRYCIKNNFLQKNDVGLYEMYLDGNAFERGIKFGKLNQELLEYQEQAFTNEIQRMVPSKKYLKFLKYVVGFMNRDLEDHVIPEFKEEIYGVSIAASSKFNWIGSNYARQLNYHAAHDIGHALANMMLVGCTSFATWNQKSKDGQLIIGRNFDFYVGDEFAKNKIVAFYEPKNGIPFVSVTWPGFTGVVSGMNNAGLTVTINANKSSIPFKSATPVSLVAREILQYAHNIQEAYAIAEKRKMFVSESFLIGSAQDNKAVVIEKTPDQLAMYESNDHQILCTNHYQSGLLSNQKLNQEQKANSASVYRYQRLKELLDKTPLNSVQTTAAILRDYRGKNNSDIGWTNEKAINQFICHHSVIFEPQKRLIWVSSAPWQMGDYVCYDLKEVLATKKIVAKTAQNIPKDTLVGTAKFEKVKTYLKEEHQFLMNKTLNPDSLLLANPNYYDTYRLLGDYYRLHKNTKKAKENYAKALGYEIATQEEKLAIEEKMESK